MFDEVFQHLHLKLGQANGFFIDADFVGLEIDMDISEFVFRQLVAGVITAPLPVFASWY